MTVELRRVTFEYLPRLRQFRTEYWGGTDMIVPGIPLVGENGIRLRDEVKLELPLPAR